MHKEPIKRVTLDLKEFNLNRFLLRCIFSPSLRIKFNTFYNLV